jgi:hypothetical protein
VEDFGVRRLARLDRAEVGGRVQEIRQMTQFDPAFPELGVGA